MKEVLRLEHIELNDEEYPALKDYHLCLFEGMVTALYGSTGSGKETLVALLERPSVKKSGQIFFCGRPIVSGADCEYLKQRIYCMGSHGRLVKSLSIVDNLVALRKVKNAFSCYQPKKFEISLQQYLQYFGIHSDINTQVSALSRWERQKLDLLKAYIGGVRLIVVDFSEAGFDSGNLQEFRELVMKLAEEGISFLLISDKPNVVMENAQRCQLIYRGTDLREWFITDQLSSEQKNKLQNTLVQMAEPEALRQDTSQLICLYDEQWQHNMIAQCVQIVTAIRKSFPQLGEKYFSFPLVSEKNLYRHKRVVAIPRNCHIKLPQNMHPKDVLTLGIPKLICCLGLIRYSRIDYLFGLFCAENKIDKNKKQVNDYTTVERKILAIHRYVLTKPDTIILEDPFIDLDSQGVQQIARYLLRIAAGVPRIVVLAQSIYDMPFTYNLVVTTRNSTMPKILIADSCEEECLEKANSDNSDSKCFTK